MATEDSGDKGREDIAVPTSTSRPSDVEHNDDSISKEDEADEMFDELERELDDGFDMGGFRERRLEELKREMTKMKQMQDTNYGRLVEMTNEKEVVKMSAEEKRCVIHFYHKDFRRCHIMNKHLETIAAKYYSTRFLRVLVENVPWLVEKLAVKVLPCVMCFMEGAVKDRIIGFEDLGNSDAFETTALELRLQLSEVVEKPKISLNQSRSTYPASGSSSAKRGIRGRDDDADDSDDD